MRPLALFLLLAAGCAPEEPLVVFASASATDVATDLATQSENWHGIPVSVSTGATSTLARQIDAGAPANVALLVGDDWSDWLGARQRLLGLPVDVAFGGLAVVIPRGAREWSDLSPLVQIGRVALADPAHVPAGRFAERALQRAGLWRQMESRVVPFPDVRSALGAVASGRADAAVVYETDVRRSDRVRVATVLPDSLLSTITYRCLVLAGSDRVAEAQRFCREAQSSVDIWERLGFAAAALRP